MLIAMAGLPGSGKSTLAARLATELNGVILSKDQVRSALFPPPVLDYSPAEDEISMDAIYIAATHIRKKFAQHPVLIDGRTFLRSAQIHDLLALAASLEEAPKIIESVCSEEVARHRVEADLAEGKHPAKNRTFASYQAVKARAEPISIPHLVLDTGRMTLEECVEQSLGYLRNS